MFKRVESEEEDAGDVILTKEEDALIVDSDDDAPLSLAERLAQRLAITSPDQKDEPVRKVKSPKQVAARKPPVKKSTKPVSKKTTGAGAVKRPRSKGTAATFDAIGLSPSVARKVKRTRVKTPKKITKAKAVKAVEEEDVLRLTSRDLPPLHLRQRGALSAETLARRLSLILLLKGRLMLTRILTLMRIVTSSNFSRVSAVLNAFWNNCKLCLNKKEPWTTPKFLFFLLDNYAASHRCNDQTQEAHYSNL